MDTNDGRQNKPQTKYGSGKVTYSEPFPRCGQKRPSKRVLAVFAEAEQIAEQLLELKVEEDRLREALEKVWRARAVAMGMLATKAEIATSVEVEEMAHRRGGKR